MVSDKVRKDILEKARLRMLNDATETYFNVSDYVLEIAYERGREDGWTTCYIDHAHLIDIGRRT